MITINTKKFIRFLLLFIIACTLAFIWSNSLQNAEESSDRSGAIVDFIKPIVDPDDSIDHSEFTHIIRKLAHFSEFALLGSELFLFTMTIDCIKKSVLLKFLITACTGFVCAVFDEHLQLTSSGRSCEFADMLIDLSGIISGSLFVALICLIVIHVRQKSIA